MRVFQSPYASTPSKPAAALTNESWSFINRFFEATGKLPQSQVLRSPDVIMLSQSDELVNKTVSVVGQVFSSKSATHTLETKERNQLRRLVAAQKRILTQRMSRPESQNTTVLLLCSLLLAIPDVSSISILSTLYPLILVLFQASSKSDCRELAVMDNTRAEFCKLPSRGG